MKKFRSEAFDREGKKYAGVFDAEDVETARKMLEAQGFKIHVLEVLPDDEVVEESFQKSKKKLASPVKKVEKVAGKSVFSATTKKPLGLLKVFLMGAFILGSFPLAIWILSPEPPSTPPENIVQKYFDYEFKNDFDKQFELLSDKLKMKSVSVGIYSKDRYDKKKQRYLKYVSSPEEKETAEVEDADERRSLDPEILEMKRIRDQKRSAELMVIVRVRDFQERYLLKAVAQNTEWKIDSSKLMSYESVAESSSLEIPAGDPQKEATKVIRPMKKSPSESKVSGMDEIKDQAIKMLDDALRNGKINRDEYQERKLKIEKL